jgi:hypothetical protein
LGKTDPIPKFVLEILETFFGKTGLYGSSQAAVVA